MPATTASSCDEIIIYGGSARLFHPRRPRGSFIDPQEQDHCQSLETQLLTQQTAARQLAYNARASSVLSQDAQFTLDTLELGTSDAASLASPTYEACLTDYRENVLEHDPSAGAVARQSSRRTRTDEVSSDASGNDSAHGFASDDRQTSQDADIFLLASSVSRWIKYDPHAGHDSALLSGRRMATKGKRHVVPENSDTELGRQLEHAWRNDRLKKKIRKEERQRQRAREGCTYQSSRADDPIVDAIATRNLVLEFVFSDQRRLTFHPMGNPARRCIHEIAHLLGCVSKSKGPKHQRAPSILKPSGYPKVPILQRSTLSYRIDHLLRYPGHASTKATKQPSSRLESVRTQARGGGNAMRRDGEVVGADAPEIGEQNRGRLMLEKLGWSTGTALGAMNNKGIMQPVLHVVKTSKTGLG